jgi:hypothetical protein
MLHGGEKVNIKCDESRDECTIFLQEQQELLRHRVVPFSYLTKHHHPSKIATVKKSDLPSKEAQGATGLKKLCCSG